MSDAAWSAAHALVMRHGWNATAYQILNPGMRLWFNGTEDAVAGYASHGGVRVVAGAPVCAPERLPSVAAELEADAEADGERLLFFGAGARLERLYAWRRDNSLVRVGAQPTWDPRAWADIVRGKSSLRAQLNRARNKGIVVAEWPLARAREADALRAVLRDWLARRGLPPLGFMVTPYLLDRGEDRRVFVAERRGAGEIAGFLVATPIPTRHGWLVEQWPRAHDAPNGTTHLLIDAAMRAFADDGSHYATLGMAPLSSHAGELGDGHSAWLRIALRWLRAHGRRFYNFRGLEAFKASMQPMAWEPLYVIARGTRITPGMLRAVAGVFGHGAPEWLVARAIASAARQELRSVLGHR